MGVGIGVCGWDVCGADYLAGGVHRRGAHRASVRSLAYAHTFSHTTNKP